MPDHNVEVVDLGLTVADAIDLDLPTETFTRKKALARWMPARLTEKEKEWFQGEHIYRGQSKCTRVELNAFTAPGLVTYIEEGLAKYGATRKVIPPKDVIDETASEHHRKLVSDIVDATLAEIADADAIVEAMVEKTAVAGRAKVGQIRKALKGNPPYPWRRVVERLVDKQLGEGRREDIKKRVREMVIDAIANE